MSGLSSPVNVGYEAAIEEPAMRLTVRKDLFPEVRLPKLGSVVADKIAVQDESFSSVNLETDFEKSIDDIANQKLQTPNGTLSSSKPRHRKHKQHSRRDLEGSVNGSFAKERKRRKHRTHSSQTSVKSVTVKSGKNLNLVSSSEYHNVNKNEDSDTSEDEVLNSVKLPINVQRLGGKPYSHELSQLSTKKNKSKDSTKEIRTHIVTPCSGKPRSMLDIRSSRSKKKSKKSDRAAIYQSQIVNTKSKIKIKIRKTNIHEVITPTPTSVADIGQRKSKKKRAASPIASESSGEEYDPSRGDTAASMSVAAPKPRHPPAKNRKNNNSKSKGSHKSEKTEKNRISGVSSSVVGPQSPWAHSMPEEVLVKIFEHVVHDQGSLPSVIRLSKVCRLWNNVASRSELWRNVDLAQYTIEKCKTDYKLVWLLENRLSQCQVLNIAHWKVCNVTWVLACIVDYCPGLEELSVAGWSRLTPEQLFDLVQGLPKLQRLDLSLTSETGGSSTCLSAISVARVAENFGQRLTHLTLANNMFTALPQILSTIAAHCPNLEVLDISGARATSHPAAIPLEALQKGCPKVRVFRAANAQLVLANATTLQQMECSGWTQLEEVSIAAEAATERVGVGEYRLGDEALARLVRGATRLRLLDLRGLQRLTDSGLVRVPAWDLQHLFLGGCNVLRQNNACLELICEKWSHSLLELDLSWASAAKVLDNAVSALADASHSKLRILSLCGSSVSLEPIKKVLIKCLHIESLNLSSCRALPRGMKRHYLGKELQDLKDSLDPKKAKTKEDEDDDEDDDSVNDKVKNNVQKKNSNSESVVESQDNKSVSPNLQSESKSVAESSSPSFQEPKSVPAPIENVLEKEILAETIPKSSTAHKKTEFTKTKDYVQEKPASVTKTVVKGTIPNLRSPLTQPKPDSSSTPRSDLAKADVGSPHFSPVSRTDNLIPNSPDILDTIKSNNSWNMLPIKTTPTHKPDLSSYTRLETQTKLKHKQFVEQCSPTTSLDNKPSPEMTNIKQDMKTPNNWNYGNYSPMPRQENQFSSQRSPYSAQPSPAQPSPYSTQPSPYSAQPSPYSSQPSPYSAQPSPDTSQIIKPEMQKTWNTGGYSPMPKHHSPFSPHPSSHASPDPGLNVKSDSIRNNPNKTPGQYSPMSRQDRIRSSPYSPRSSVENNAYSNLKSPGVGNYSPMMRNDSHLTSPDPVQSTRSMRPNRSQELFGRSVANVSELMQNTPQPDVQSSWGVERFNPLSSATSAGIEPISWASSFVTEPTHDLPAMLNTPTPQTQSWNGLPSFDTTITRNNHEVNDPWTLGQFRMEPHHQVQNFVEQNISFDSLSSHMELQSQIPHNYLDDSFTETSRVD